MQASLPDFGIWQEAVVNWVYYMYMMLSDRKNIFTKLDHYNTKFPNLSELKETFGHNHL